MSDANSMMEALRQKHKELAQSHTVDLELPGYDDVLVAKYRVLDVTKELSRISQRTAREFKDPIEQALFGSIDAMATACEGLSTTVDGRLVPLSESIGPDEPPIKFDQRLVEFMGWEGEYQSARDVILKLFDGIEPMILDHGRVLSGWMTNTTRDANQVFAGNV